MLSETERLHSEKCGNELIDYKCLRENVGFLYALLDTHVVSKTCSDAIRLECECSKVSVAKLRL